MLYKEPPNQPQSPEILAPDLRPRLKGILDASSRGWTPSFKEYKELPDQPPTPKPSQPIRQPELRPCYHIIEEGKLVRISGMP